MVVQVIRSEDYSPYANDPQPHDNMDGPCKCGAWHEPKEFEGNENIISKAIYWQIVSDLNKAGRLYDEGKIDENGQVVEQKNETK